MKIYLIPTHTLSYEFQIYQYESSYYLLVYFQKFIFKLLNCFEFISLQHNLFIAFLPFYHYLSNQGAICYYFSVDSKLWIMMPDVCDKQSVESKSRAYLFWRLAVLISYGFYVWQQYFMLESRRYHILRNDSQLG